MERGLDGIVDVCARAQIIIRRVCMCVCVWVCVCSYALFNAVFIRASQWDAWPTVPATPPAARMIGLIVINNQPIHGPCVTAEFSVTDEPSCAGVSVCVCVCVCVCACWWTGLGIWGWTGLLRSVSCDRPLALILSALEVNSLRSHFTLDGKWKGGKKKPRGREEWGRGGEKMILDSEEEGWSRRREGQEGSQAGKWEKLLGGWTDEEDKNIKKRKWTKTQKTLVSEAQSSYFLFAKICSDLIILHT